MSELRIRCYLFSSQFGVPGLTPQIHKYLGRALSCSAISSSPWLLEAFLFGVQNAHDLFSESF
jgi:hypothetical protein